MKIWKYLSIMNELLDKIFYKYCFWQNFYKYPQNIGIKNKL